MKKILTVLLLFMTIVLVQCGGEKIQLKAVNATMKLTRRPSLEGPGGLVPRGLLSFTVMVQNEKGEAITDHKLVKPIVVNDPQGKLYKVIKNSSLGMETRSYWNGFFTYGKELKMLVWLGLDFIYDVDSQPATGEYEFIVTSKSGHKSRVKTTFKGQKEDPIKGFPENIKYHQETRTVTWKGTTGQNSYRINVIEGEMGRRVDWSKLVFSSSWGNEVIKTEKFIIPKQVNLEKGKKYHILVTATDSPDGKAVNDNYVHTQDQPEHLAIFVAE